MNLRRFKPAWVVWQHSGKVSNLRPSSRGFDSWGRNRMTQAPCHRRRAATTIRLAETCWSSKIHLAESDLWGRSVPELWGPHGMEEGKGPGCLAPSRQYGNALLGVHHQEEEEESRTTAVTITTKQLCMKSPTILGSKHWTIKNKPK